MPLTKLLIFGAGVASGIFITKTCPNCRIVQSINIPTSQNNNTANQPSTPNIYNLYDDGKIMLLAKYRELVEKYK